MLSSKYHALSVPEVEFSDVAFTIGMVFVYAAKELGSNSSGCRSAGDKFKMQGTPK